MIFMVLTFLAAFALEGLGTYISVMGLAKTFAADPIILTLAVTLDLAKLVVVSLLYKKWDSLNSLFKAYFIPAAMVLMLITSYGAAGYLSDNFQKATFSNNTAQIQLSEIEKEKEKLETRKIEIDKQIAQIPPDRVRARINLTKNFKAEIDHINGRLIELDKQVPELKKQKLEIESHIGPISFIAKIFGTSMEAAVSVIIGLIIFVFEPLAIMLLLAGNFLQREYEKSKHVSVKYTKADISLADVYNTEPTVISNKGVESVQQEVQQKAVSHLQLPPEEADSEAYDDYGFERIEELKKQKTFLDDTNDLHPTDRITIHKDNAEKSSSKHFYE